jgi:uncharacterized protein (TIGR03067 family)
MRSFLVLAFFAAPVLAESKDEYLLRKTMESLQGNWSVKNMTVAGQAADPGAIKSLGYRFDGDSFSRTDMPDEAARMTIDPSGRVPKIELIDRYAVVRVGIVQRQGNKVFICLVEAGETPPINFESTKKNNAVLMEMVPMKR